MQPKAGGEESMYWEAVFYFCGCRKIVCNQLNGFFLMARLHYENGSKEKGKISQIKHNKGNK
uniref:Uncharacterized protein n=1 Tax=Romanomermis culicivorax TaxID=13658 RepID=A0A915K5X4_ROMCU